MSEALRGFFASASAYFADPGPAALATFLARHPGWEAAPDRVALYGAFVRGHVEGTLGKLFPGVRALAGPEAWAALVRAFYARRPATHYGLNRLGAELPAFLAGRAGLPPFAVDLARLEWTLFEVFARDEPAPDEGASGLNPTLTTLELEHAVCSYYAAFLPDGQEGTLPPGPPPAAPELALVWRDPRTLRARYQAATPRALLAIKMALEGIGPDQAAAAGGVERDVIDAVIEDFTRTGLLIGARGEAR